MKKTLMKALSSAIALTLVLASAGFAAAPTEKIPTDEIKAVKATAAVQEVKAEEKEVKEVKEVKEDGVLAAIEAKVKEEAVAKVKEAKAPAVEIAKTAAAAEITAPKAEVKEEVKAAPEIKVAPAAEVKAEAPVAEVPEAPVEEAPVEEAEAPVATEAEPTKEWNISATEFDNVAMSFYAEPAAPASQVNIDAQSGVVRIKGTGAMEENVYRHFMSKEKFLTAIEALFEAEYGVEVDLVYDDNITDVLELDRNLYCYSRETGEELLITSNMRMNLNPVEFLEYSPKTIVIEEGITNVSDFAFVFCGDVEEVILPSTIESVGEFAFEYCANLRRVVVPENAEIKEGAFGYCKKLTAVELVDEASYGEPMAENAENNAPVKTLTAEEINALVYEW